jgi:predicted PurR-regulated permease PerM
VVTLVFNLIVGVPYAPLIAVVVAITNIIPTFGPVIGGAIGLFFIVLESPIKALIFLVFICVLQAIDGAIIKTKLFSGSLGISGVWTLVLIIIGGKIAGVLGIILAIPLSSLPITIYIILQHARKINIYKNFLKGFKKLLTKDEKYVIMLRKFEPIRL